MIEVTRLDNSKVVINAQFIHSVQAVPDTIITFTTKEKMIVKEPLELLSQRIIDYQRKIHSGIPFIPQPDCTSPTSFCN